VECAFCDKEGATKRLVTQLVVVCTECENVKCTLNRHGCFEVSFRLPYGLRCNGNSKKANQTLCAVVNLPTSGPLHKSNIFLKAVGRFIRILCDLLLQTS
jgi:hypothetical protein